MNALSRAFYVLTAYVPRKLPTNEKEYDKLLDVFEHAFGVPVDEPAAYVAIAGHIRSVPGTKIRAPWGNIANAAKRAALVNEYANRQHQLGMEVLQKKLEAAVKRVQEEQGPSDPPSEKQPQTDAVANPAPDQVSDPVAS